MEWSTVCIVHTPYFFSPISVLFKIKLQKRQAQFSMLLQGITVDSP